jgi:Ca-activated chloride channel homolog
MTFLAGWWLLLLLAPLALLSAYVAAQRARARYSVRFTDVELLASVAPKRPGWQRHVAGGLLLAALSMMAVALGRPAIITRTPRERATVMLTLDTSASMAATDVTPSRLDAAKTQAKTFVAHLPAGIKVGVIQFSTTASVVAAPSVNRDTVNSAINGLQEDGGTATGDAIQLALQAIKALPVAVGNKPAPAVIVLLSDGTPTLPRDDAIGAAEAAAQAAAAAHVAIDTIAFGTANGAVQVQGQLIPAPADPDTMTQIAVDSNGTAFTATSQDELGKVYDSIGRAVGYDLHKRDVSSWFIGIALLIGISAACASLIWMHRLP